MTVIYYISTHSSEIVIYTFKFTKSSAPYVVQSLSHVRLCDPTDCSALSFSVLQCLLEFAQIHVH